MKIIYVGKDDSYFESLKKRFQEVEGHEYEFKKIYHDNEDTFQKIAALIVNELPNIAFLDYSAHPLKMLTVARSLPRLFNRGPTLIGLWDALAPEELIKESFTIGIPFTHFKSPEISDIVSQAIFLYSGGAFPEGDFAKADVMKKPVSLAAFSLMRAGFVTESYVHVEHDILPPEKGEFFLLHNFGPEFPLDKFRVERRLDNNFYYEMSYTSDMSFVFVDPEEAKKENEKNKKRAFWQKHSLEQGVEVKKKKVTTFIEGHGIQNLPKRTRLMIIDKEMSVLHQATKPLDSYSYSVRAYHSFLDHKGLLSRIEPGIICYQCPDKSEGELGDIMTAVEQKDNFNPFVVIFNSSWKSEKLQEHYNYSRIIGWSEKFSIDMLLQFCDTYEKRLGRDKSHDARSSYHHKEKRYYIPKNSPESFLEYQFDINMRAICETWLKFQCSEKLPIWAILHVKKPIPFSFTIIEELSETAWLREGQFQYRGVIHGLGEKDRANMRRSINQMIYNENKNDEDELAQEEKKSDES